MALNHSPSIVTNGLVLYLDAANRRSYPGSGTTWFDISGYNNHATLVNGPVFNNTKGGAISFDGLNDYADINGATSSLSTITNYTLSLWILANATSNKVIMEKGANLKMLVQPGTSNFIYYGDYSESDMGVYIFNNTWRNVHVVQSATQRKFFLNGILRHTGSGGPRAANSDSIVLMSRFGNFAQAGSVSLLKVWNRALSDNEVLQNYNATKGRFGL